MSGICGIINFDGVPVDPGALQKMAAAAAHRGPDGIRYRLDGKMGLAHLALDITPQSVREQQPLATPDGDLVLVADARIDNRNELSRTLMVKGHLVDRDPTDADLILAAYRCWDTDCAVHLIGDFAFAIWDNSHRRLFAARDPMAMRAFYYRVESRRILFASEVKQILAVPGVPIRIFEPAVGAHLAGLFGPLQWTFYEGIDQLLAAHVLVMDARRHRIRRYWDIDPDYRIQYADENQYAEHFLEIFKEAVKCRLRSVKPVGIFLSGGMDSGSIASTAGWLLQRNSHISSSVFHPYCWAFEELSQCDERTISDGIVRHFGFPATNILADTAYPLRDYPAHGPDRDEPFVGVYQALIDRTLAAARSDGIGWMLSGDRGDLMVGGWILDYTKLLRALQWRDLWGELQIHSRATGETHASIMRSYLLRPLILTLQEKSAIDWWHWSTQKILNIKHRFRMVPYPKWVRPEFARRLGLAELIEKGESQPSLNGFSWRRRYQLIFAHMHMRGVIWSERSYARYGLGFADPWSDQRIAQFILAVPQQVINRPGEVNKQLARRTMQGIMPAKVLQAACKIVPMPLYERALKDWAKDTVIRLITNSQAAAHGYLCESSLLNSYESYLKGEPLRHAFWWALTLEMWLSQYW